MLGDVFIRINDFQ